jgi:heme/copper-type cytochrome/quinol oxidase subunit 2
VFFLAQQPIVVDLARQPQPSQDISIQVVLSMFAVAGIFLLVALVGCVIVAGGMILYKRRRDAAASPQETQHTHIRLGI